MILRKPYALLIKFFRPIHFILAILVGYLSYRFYDVYLFLKGYIANGYYNYVDSLVDQFINFPIYVALILVLILIIVLISLLTYKKKPTLLYWLILVSCIFAIFFLSFLKSNLGLLEIDRVNIRNLLIIRDISIGLSVVEVGLLLWALLRSLGFNLKSFQFSKDIKELQVEMKDDEEFEFTIDVDRDELSTKFRGKMRRFKYYLAENKSVFLTILIVLMISVAGIIVNSTIIKNRTYQEGKIVKLNSKNYNIKVINSYLTDQSYDKKSIGNYIIVKFEILNQTANSIKFDLSKINLVVDNKIYESKNPATNYFKDMGILYTNQSIENSSAKYLVAYKLKDLNYKKTYILIKDNKKMIKINLNPMILTNISSVSSSKIGDELSFNTSIFSKSSLKINEYKIANNFIFKEDSKEISIYPTNLKKINTILYLDANLNITSELAIYPFSISEFISNFAKLKYLLDEKIYESELIDKTPTNFNNRSFFEVDSNIAKAQEIYLEIIIRDKQYTYYLLKQ